MGNVCFMNVCGQAQCVSTVDYGKNKQQQKIRIVGYRVEDHRTKQHIYILAVDMEAALCNPNLLTGIWCK